ncbi:hypothetical protein Tco_0606681, partial [Tanacetum coccineum]
SEHPEKKHNEETFANLARAKPGKYYGEAGVSKDTSCPESPGELRRSWYIEGHLGYEGVSSGEAKLTHIFTKIKVFSPSSSSPRKFTLIFGDIPIPRHALASVVQQEGYNRTNGSNRQRDDVSQKKNAKIKMLKSWILQGTKTKARLRESRTPLVGFSDEVNYLIGVINLNVTMGELGKLQTVTMKFAVVKIHSRYNVILGRACLRSLGAVASTIHLMIKFPTDNRIAMKRPREKPFRSAEGQNKHKDPF